jgi:hypothetical protein
MAPIPFPPTTCPEPHLGIYQDHSVVKYQYMHSRLDLVNVVVMDAVRMGLSRTLPV